LPKIHFVPQGHNGSLKGLKGKSKIGGLSILPLKQKTKNKKTKNIPISMFLKK